MRSPKLLYIFYDAHLKFKKKYVQIHSYDFFKINIGVYNTVENGILLVQQFTQI